MLDTKYLKSGSPKLYVLWTTKEFYFTMWFGNYFIPQFSKFPRTCLK